MRILVKILVLFVLVGCKTDKKKEFVKPSFDLKKDFSKITKSITEQDTIEVIVDLTLYYHDYRNEKLEISSFGDSLKILISGRVGFDNFYEDEAVSIYREASLKVQGPRKPEIVKIHKDDSRWKFDSLINKNLDSLIVSKNDYHIPKLILRNHLDTLNFDFSSKRSWKTFKKEYCKMMFELTPHNKFYSRFIRDYYSE